MFYSDDPDIIGTRLAVLIDTMLARLGAKDIEVDYGRFRSLIDKMSRVNEPDGFPHADGFEAASAYKKAAYFFNLFTAIKPIRSVKPINSIPEKLWKEASDHSPPDWLNTYVGFLLIKIGLHGIGYMNCHKEPVTLAEPIHVSLHTMQDMIEAYSDATTIDKFQLTALLIEQICYKVNSFAEYRDRV
ncbi:MAG: hypothetical protein EA353_13290 [Puniceicoccaceae bacterium]|nr:MAG: hypothetical protein EA353_13290 [Puniceicoccaceae bacterium]